MSRHLSLLQCWYCSQSPRSRDKNRNYSLTLSRGYFENIISYHFLEHHRVSAASVYLKRRAISVLTGAKILEGLLPPVLPAPVAHSGTPSKLSWNRIGAVPGFKVSRGPDTLRRLAALPTALGKFQTLHAISFILICGLLIFLHFQPHPARIVVDKACVIVESVSWIPKGFYTIWEFGWPCS